jgi:hypothetical protein
MDGGDAVVRRRMTKNQQNSHPTDATKRIAQLEASNAALQAALTSKTAHITMLEERLLTMSVELASSRAREDEQKLMYRRSKQQVVDGSSVDDESAIINGHVPKPVRNGRRRRGSCGSSVSPCSDDQADLIDASIKSAPPIQMTTTTSSNCRRFSLMSSRGSSRAPLEDLNDSARSYGSAGGGFGGFIGNLINNLDRSERCEDLNVNFPTGRRRSSIMTDDFPPTVNSHSQEQQQQQRRVSMVGQLFRLRKSELTTDDAVEEEEIICEQQQQDEEQQHQHQVEGEQAPPQRRKPNRSKMLRCQASTRLISSTVAFPRENDDDSMGFE